MLECSVCHYCLMMVAVCYRNVGKTVPNWLAIAKCLTWTVCYAEQQSTKEGREKWRKWPNWQKWQKCSEMMTCSECASSTHSKPCPLHTIPLNKTALQCDKFTFNTAVKGKLLRHTITHRIVKQLHMYVRTLSYSICWLTN